MTDAFYQGSERVMQAENSAIRDLMETVSHLKQSYDDVLGFSAGEPDFDTPEPIKRETVMSLERGETHYTSSYGVLSLRQAVSRSIEKKTGCHYNPETEIMITCGAAEAINNVIFSFINPGDEVLVFTPAFVTYKNLIHMCGGIFKEVPCKAEDGFQFDMELVKSLTTTKTKAVLLNNPCNPTGSVFSRESLEQLCAWAKEKNLIVISDEIYADITYDGKKAYSIASFPEMKERLILISGFSKTYAMTGWRMGYVAADERFFDALMKFHIYCTTCAPTFLQEGIARGIETKETQEAVEKMTETFARRRRIVMDILNQCEKITYTVPYGAFYIMADVSGTGMDGKTFAQKLLETRHVAVVPAESMGQGCENMVRISYACGENAIREGLGRIVEFEKQC